MKPDQIKALAIEWYGRGWQSKLASALETDRTTVWRWFNSGSIPGPAKAAIKCWSKSGGPSNKN